MLSPLKFPAWNPGAESLNAAGVASQTDRGP